MRTTGTREAAAPMIFAGMDIGSRTIKAVLFDAANQAVIARELCDQGVDQEELALAIYQRMLESAGLDAGSIAGSVATGYGRNLIQFADDTVTEITCHAAGVVYLHPDARTIIDIGGEDSKVIRLNDRQKVHDFVMNDRCAAGTGRFLEIVASRLEGDLQSVSEAAVGHSAPAAISSMCVVFAETEIVGLLASGASKESIMAGVQKSVAERVNGMLGRQVHLPLYFTGGVALVPGMAPAIARIVGRDIAVCSDPQFTGALGAAIMASHRKGR